MAKKSKASEKAMAIVMTMIMFVAIIVAVYALVDGNYALFLFSVLMGFLFYVWIFFFERFAKKKR